MTGWVKLVWLFQHTVKTVNNMRTSKINIGTKVFNKKNQEGTITKVITKSTGYVEVTYSDGLSTIRADHI